MGWPLFIGDKAQIISIDWQKRCVYIFAEFFEPMFYGTDAPSPIRLLAYMKASQWKRSIEKDLPCNENQDDIIIAISIASIKGLQLFHSDVSPNNKFPSVQRQIKKLTGLNSDIKVVRPPSRDSRTVVYVKNDNAAKNHILKLTELIQSESSLVKPLDKITDGELGSKSNPFPNVNIAAEHILELEKKKLANDNFRSYLNDTHYYYDPEHQIFRIPWASPYVGYLDGKGVIENGFVVNQLVSGRFNFKPNLVCRKFLYRGQAEFFDICVPNMFRNHSEDYFLKYNIFSCEMHILLDSHPLIQLFKNGFELFHDRFVFEVNYGGLSQHYYNKTPFLDLTSDIDAAKFFAVTTFDMNKNCYVPYHKEDIGVLYYYDIEPNAFIPVGNKYHLSTIGKQSFMRPGAQHGYILSMAKGVNFNTLPQVRYVFFKHNRVVTDEIFKRSKNGSIYKSDDILQHYWYAKLTDIEKNNIVSHEALMLNWKYNKTTSKRKLLKRLAEAGIKVERNLKPTFSIDELHNYYFKNAEENWRKFCEDIYFYSPEGRILKEHLLNLPNNPTYHKYFYE